MATFCALHDVEAKKREEATNHAPKSTSDVWVASRSSSGIWTLVLATT